MGIETLIHPVPTPELSITPEGKPTFAGKLVGQDQPDMLSAQNVIRESLYGPTIASRREVQIGYRRRLRRGRRGCYGCERTSCRRCRKSIKDKISVVSKIHLN